MCSCIDQIVWHNYLINDSSYYYHPLKYTGDDPNHFPHSDLSGILYMNKLRAIFVRNICSDFTTLNESLSHPQSIQEAVSLWEEEKGAGIGRKIISEEKSSTFQEGIRV